jgi:hypothetical protein
VEPLLNLVTDKDEGSSRKAEQDEHRVRQK